MEEVDDDEVEVDPPNEDDKINAKKDVIADEDIPYI